MNYERETFVRPPEMVKFIGLGAAPNRLYAGYFEQHNQCNKCQTTATKPTKQQQQKREYVDLGRCTTSAMP